MSQFNVRKNEASADQIYFDITSTNFESISKPPEPFYYNEARQLPFIEKPEDYYLSIMRFTTETQNLPVFIPSIKPQVDGNNDGDANLTIYTVTLQIADRSDPLNVKYGSAVQVPVYWRPQNQSAPIPTSLGKNGQQNNSTGYYNCDSYEYFIMLVQEALNTAFAGITKDPNYTKLPVTLPPQFCWDSTLTKAFFVVDTAAYCESYSNSLFQSIPDVVPTTLLQQAVNNDKSTLFSPSAGESNVEAYDVVGKMINFGNVFEQSADNLGGAIASIGKGATVQNATNSANTVGSGLLSGQNGAGIVNSVLGGGFSENTGNPSSVYQAPLGALVTTQLASVLSPLGIASSTIILLARNNLIGVGQTVTGSNVPLNTKVASVSGTTVQLNNAVPLSPLGNTLYSFYNSVESLPTSGILPIHGSDPIAGITPPAKVNFAQSSSLKIDVYFNTPLFNLFNSFPSYFNGYNTEMSHHGRNRRILFANRNGINESTYKPSRIVVDASNTLYASPDYYTGLRLDQEYPTVYNLSPITSVVFCSNTLPINPNLVSSPLIFNNNHQITIAGANSAIANIITDLTADDGNYRPYLVYLPDAEYRLITLSGNRPLYNLDLTIFYRTKFGELIPFQLASGSTMTIKLAFIKKSSYSKSLLSS